MWIKFHKNSNACSFYLIFSLKPRFWASFLNFYIKLNYNDHNIPKSWHMCMITEPKCPQFWGNIRTQHMQLFPVLHVTYCEHALYHAGFVFEIGNNGFWLMYIFLFRQWQQWVWASTRLVTLGLPLVCMVLALIIAEFPKWQMFLVSWNGLSRRSSNTRYFRNF